MTPPFLLTAAVTAGDGHCLFIFLLWGVCMASLIVCTR